MSQVFGLLMGAVVQGEADLPMVLPGRETNVSAVMPLERGVPGY
jgi:hypothetical protein